MEGERPNQSGRNLARVNELTPKRRTRIPEEIEEEEERAKRFKSDAHTFGQNIAGGAAPALGQNDEGAVGRNDEGAAFGRNDAEAASAASNK